MPREPQGREPSEAEQRLALLEHACREKALRLTPQRRVLLETLVESPDHPSAEQIHARVGRKMPGLSRATVFRILEQLVAGGVIGKASHPGRRARYDVRAERHHHLICLGCESMTDININDESLDRLPVPERAEDGFTIVDLRVQLRGYCSTCQGEMNHKGSR